MNTNNRRFFLKTLALSGLAFSGVNSFAGFTPQEKKDNNKKVKHWDVIVAGGGPGGIPAAIAAAENGAKVLLIEQYGFLGGMATSALVHPFMPFNAGELILTQGSFTKLLNRMTEQGAYAIENGRWKNRMIDSEPMKRILDVMCLESGVQLLFHAQVMGVLSKKGKIEAIRVLHKGGVEDLSADIFIDSTGDGDVAAWAGAPSEVGRKEDNAVQPMTLSFRMANVNTEIMDGSEMTRLYNIEKEKGNIQNPRENVLLFKCIQKDVVHFNTTRIIGKSSLDGWSMTEAEIEGRRQVEQMVSFLKTMKGFENSYLQKTGPQIGVRESRRIIGNYLLTADDVLAGTHFDDGIAATAYPLDIHNPSGTGTVMKHLKKGEYYTIPYRCIVPKNTSNLLVASRCISATHEAHSSLRVMPCVWGIGEAAGTAAAMCVKNNTAPSAIDTNLLRENLKNQGAFVG